MLLLTKVNNCVKLSNLMDLRCSYNALMTPSGTFIHLFPMFKNTAWQNSLVLLAFGFVYCDKTNL